MENKKIIVTVGAPISGGTVDSVNGEVGAVVLDGTDIELLEGGGVTVTQAVSDLDNDKLDNSSQTNRLLGRYSSGTGQIEEVQIGSGLSLTPGGTLQAQVSGDVVLKTDNPSKTEAAGIRAFYDATTSTLEISIDGTDIP